MIPGAEGLPTSIPAGLGPGVDLVGLVSICAPGRALDPRRAVAAPILDPRRNDRLQYLHAGRRV
ncbi:MAG: hypothetical protein OXN93_08280 [bacterium]|nr:hypothetical protein [bacterium]